MRWPFSRKPKPPAVDVEALVAQAAEKASTAIAQEIARKMWADSPAPGAPTAGLSTTWSKSPYPVYNNNNPWKYYTPIAPTRRPDSILSLEDIRRFADTYDVLRSVIQHLKREVFAVPLEFVPKDEKDKSPETHAQIKEAEAFFATRGGLGGFGKTRKEFEGMILEDLLVIGAGAIYYQPNRVNRPFQAIPFDSATIRPRVDAYGWPGPGDAYYEQWVMGLKVGTGFTLDQMFWGGLPTNARSYSPYPASSVEWLMATIMRGLQSDNWNLAWLTDGNSPSERVALPLEWTPEQVIEWADYEDSLTAGNSRARQKTRYVPGGSQLVNGNGRKDQDFTQLEDSTMRRTCSLYGVAPASIGYAGDQYKESQGDSMDSTSEFGAGELLEFRVDIYTDCLQRMELDRICVRNVEAKEEKSGDRAKRFQILGAGAAVLTQNEMRAEEGKDPIEGGNTLFVPSTLQPIEHALIPPPDPLEMAKAKGAVAGNISPGSSSTAPDKKAAKRVDLELWERKVLNRLKAGKLAACEFESDDIPEVLLRRVRGLLDYCTSDAEVKAVFNQARDFGLPVD